MKLTLAELVAATSGQLVGGKPEMIVARIGTDTRTIEPGMAFLALRGDRFDGHAFIPEALRRGANLVIASEVPAGWTGAVPMLVVHDTTCALGRIASWWRDHLAPRVVAITGSAGKTTTKEMVAHLLGANANVLATEGNLNNHIGLPFTMMRLEPSHGIAVLELGMNHSGEIRYLTELCRPDVGVLTNVGDAHIGNFPNHEALIRAKGELFETMAPKGVAIMNADCERTKWLRANLSLPTDVVLFGESESADVRASNVTPCMPFGFAFTLSVPGERVDVRVPVFGRYQVMNALAATATALQHGVELSEVVRLLETFEPPKMRSRVHNVGGVRVVEDCYNASPSAMIAAIESFASFSGDGRRFLLLGDMYELGDFSEHCHREVGQATARALADEVYCVGKSSLWIADEARSRGVNARYFSGLEPAVEQLARQLVPGDAVLVKGSRLARLERAVERLAVLLGNDAQEAAL